MDAFDAHESYVRPVWEVYVWCVQPGTTEQVDFDAMGETLTARGYGEPRYLDRRGCNGGTEIGWEWTLEDWAELVRLSWPRVIAFRLCRPGRGMSLREARMGTFFEGEIIYVVPTEVTEQVAPIVIPETPPRLQGMVYHGETDNRDGYRITLRGCTFNRADLILDEDDRIYPLMSFITTLEGATSRYEAWTDEGTLFTSDSSGMQYLWQMFLGDSTIYIIWLPDEPEVCTMIDTFGLGLRDA